MRIELLLLLLLHVLAPVVAQMQNFIFQQSCIFSILPKTYHLLDALEECLRWIRIGVAVRTLYLLLVVAF
jgi:hypothetical protein